MKKYSFIISSILFYVFGFGFFVSLCFRLDNSNGDIFIYNIYLGVFSVLFLLSCIYYIKFISKFVQAIFNIISKDWHWIFRKNLKDFF